MAARSARLDGQRFAPSNPAAPLSPAVETYLTALQTACVRMTWQEGSKKDEGYNFMIGVLRYSFLLHREASGRQMTAVPFAVLLPEPVLSGCAISSLSCCVWLQVTP